MSDKPREFTHKFGMRETVYIEKSAYEAEFKAHRETWAKKCSLEFELDKLAAQAKDYENKWYQSNKERAQFEAELAKTKADLAEVVESWISRNNELVSSNDKLRDELARKDEVLKFYADPNTYRDRPEDSAPIVDDMTTGPNDFGHRARQVLSPKGGGT